MISLSFFLEHNTHQQNRSLTLQLYTKNIKHDRIRRMFMSKSQISIAILEASGVRLAEVAASVAGPSSRDFLVEARKKRWGWPLLWKEHNDLDKNKRLKKKALHPKKDTLDSRIHFTPMDQWTKQNQEYNFNTIWICYTSLYMASV